MFTWAHMESAVCMCLHQIQCNKYFYLHTIFKGQNIHLGPMGSRHIVPLEITKTLDKLNETMFHKTQAIKQQKKTNP